MPVGDQWPDWRDGNDSYLQRMLDRPIDGFVWDALNQDPAFWPPSWGARPKTAHEVERTVRSKLAQWPTLVPIYGHRYHTCGPGTRWFSGVLDVPDRRHLLRPRPGRVPQERTRHWGRTEGHLNLSEQGAVLVAVR